MLCVGAPRGLRSHAERGNEHGGLLGACVPTQSVGTSKGAWERATQSVGTSKGAWERATQSVGTSKTDYSTAKYSPTYSSAASRAARATSSGSRSQYSGRNNSTVQTLS